MIVGRLIPAGTGSVMNRMREIAADRDKVLADQTAKDESAALAASVEAAASESASIDGDD